MLEKTAAALIQPFWRIHSAGHTAGDRTLQKISEIMRACVRDQDTVGRYGGDEFCVILSNVTKLEAKGVFERMRLLAEQNFSGQNGEQRSTLSIGAAMYSSETNVVVK